MTKFPRTIKASLIIGILLFSLGAVLIPSVSAGPFGLFDVDPVMQMGYEASAIEQRITPAGGVITIPLKIKFLVGGPFARTVIKVFKNNVPAIVDLRVKESPDWATVSVNPTMVQPVLKEDGYDVQEAVLIVGVSENAPAMVQGKVVIEMIARERTAYGIFRIRGATQTGEIIFTPDFLPVISVSPQNNFELISPGKTANFDIDIGNLGNGKTLVTFRILNIPEGGWTASISSSVTIGSRLLGEDASATVRLTVQPPLGFGYHSEKESIQVEITPYYYTGDIELAGQTFTETFTIESRGFSTPGFEIVFALFALVGVALLVRHRKNAK